MAKKPPSNPLIAGGAAGFSLADSFGITATLPAVAVANAEEDSFVGGGGAAAAGPAMPPPASPWLGAPAPATSSSEPLPRVTAAARVAGPGTSPAPCPGTAGRSPPSPD